MARDLDHPWGIGFLPDGGVSATERPGRLRLTRDSVAVELPGGPHVRVRAQGGLLDIELHPRFEANRWVYLTYSKPGPRGATMALARARFDGMALRDLEDVFVAEAWTRSGALDGEHLRRVVFDGYQPVREEGLVDDLGRVRQVKAGLDGLLYLLTDERGGAVLRLKPLE